MAALPQRELSVKVAQLLGLEGPWQCQVCRDTDCFHHRSYGPIRVFLWASCSWWSEDLFGQPFPVAPPIQVLRGLPCMGSFSIVWHIRHIEKPGICGLDPCFSSPTFWGQVQFYWTLLFSPLVPSSYGILHGSVYSFALVRYSCPLSAGVLHAPSVSEGVFLMYSWREMYSTSTYSSAILFSPLIVF